MPHLPSVDVVNRRTLSPTTEDVSVELDALLIDVLRTRIVAKVERCIGSYTLAEVGHPTVPVIGCYTL